MQAGLIWVTCTYQTVETDYDLLAAMVVGMTPYAGALAVVLTGGIPAKLEDLLITRFSNDNI